MATNTKSPPAEIATPNQPPDEQFWVKYSRHHELPISGMTSLAWHVLAVVVILVVAWVVAKNAPDDMPIEMVNFGPPGGGGQQSTGNDSKAGTGSTMTEAATAEQLPPDAKLPTDPLKDIPGLQITPKDLLNEIEISKDAERELAKIADRGTRALEQLSKLDKRMRDALMGNDKGTPGTGGGKNGGDGTGTGNQSGPGDGNARWQRKLRWTISFNTQSGGDYLRQLDVLGAILAIKTPDGELKCVKNLMARPTKLETEDLKKLNRIFWIDDKRESVEQLARALGLDFVPNEVVALFPQHFEKELLQKELSFRNRTEKEILETRFQILMRGHKYEIVVTDQRYF